MILKVKYQMTRRLFNLSLTFFTALVTFAVIPAAQAQEKQPLRIVVGFPPGGSADILARMIANALRDDYSAIVENKAGAAGRIALTYVKGAKPDGQTVIVLPSGPMVLFPHVYKKLDYDAVKDFTPISQIARFQFGVVSGPATKAKNIADMVSKTKSDPTSASYGTPGAGTLPHFMGVLLEQSTGISLNHVPFQGGAPANNALLGGILAINLTLFLKQPKCIILARLELLPSLGLKETLKYPMFPPLRNPA